MNFANLFRIALKALGNNKFRGFLTMLGIIIGIAAAATAAFIAAAAANTVFVDIIQLIERIAPNIKRPIGKRYFDLCPFGYDIVFDNNTASVNRYAFGANGGHLFMHYIVAFLFIFQAAHKSSANSGNLCGIQGKILLFCHLDRYRNKLR